MGWSIAANIWQVGVEGIGCWVQFHHTMDMVYEINNLNTKLRDDIKKVVV